MMIAYTIITLLALLAAASCELSRDLMMLQQNSYRPERYSRWLRESGDTTAPRRLMGFVVFFIALSLFSHALGSQALMLLFGAFTSWHLLRQKYKKPLVWTPRARRIYAVAAVLALLTIVGAVFAFACSVDSALYSAAVAALGVYCASHCYMFAAVWLLKPVDKAINRKFYNRAAGLLQSMPDLKIVGITGSYGKTSTKHYLHRILSECYQTAMTPGSFNTTLGVIRTIREHLKPYDKVFIVEMGAKQPGDIKEICELVHPSIGIITAVGEQHLESFGSIENVQKTKFELADSLPADGLAVINNDFEKIADRKVNNTPCVRYAVSATVDASWTAENVEYSERGTSFIAKGEGLEIPLATKLVGECNISNLLACVAVAVHLGVPVDKIRYAVSRIEQVEHRLNLKRTPAGITIIDDAFNSNPMGSAMALDVISRMTGGKRIVITPGMIELGERTEELNRRFGEKMASCADIAIVVGKYNREAIVAGLKDGGMPDGSVMLADTFAHAQQLLQGIVSFGDTVLYENDLPDTFK